MPFFLLVHLIAARWCGYATIGILLAGILAPDVANVRCAFELVILGLRFFSLLEILEAIRSSSIFLQYKRVVSYFSNV